MSASRMLSKVLGVVLLLGTGGCAPPPEWDFALEACRAIELGSPAEALPRAEHPCCPLGGVLLSGDPELVACCQALREGTTRADCTPQQCADPVPQAEQVRVGGDAEGHCRDRPGTMAGAGHCVAFIVDGKVAATAFTCQD